MVLIHLKFIKLLIIGFFTVQLAYGQAFQKYNTELGLPYNEVFKVCQDEEGLLYVGTSNGLIVLGGTWLKEYNSSNTPGFSNSVVDILPVHKNMLILGTEHNGLFLLKKESDKIERLNLRSNSKDLILQVRALHQDNSGNIWVGTRNQGLFKFHVDSIQSISKEPFVDSKRAGFFDNITVTDICSTNDKLWLGTLGEGVYTLDRNASKSIIPIHSNFQSGNKNIWCMEAFNHSLFIGTENGLSVVDLQSGNR